jgi:hypothetical protein
MITPILWFEKQDYFRDYCIGKNLIGYSTKLQNNNRSQKNYYYREIKKKVPNSSVNPAILPNSGV